MSHYTKEELELYRHHQMSRLAQTRCKKHLADCIECTKLLKELEQDDKLIADLKFSVQTYQNFADITQKSNISL